MLKNILAIQMNSIIGDYEANCKKVSDLISNFYDNYCKKVNKKPDIIFLPEVWTLGWYTDCFRDLAKKNEDSVEFLSEIARKYDANIIGGSYIRLDEVLSIEGKPPVYKNSCPIISRSGKLCALYDKIHLYSPDGEAKAVISGDTPLIVDIEGLKIGLSICYDIRFPELFRSYMVNENKPDLLVNLSAWPKTRRIQYDAMAKCRAVENQSYFLALSQTGLIKNNVYNSGYSSLIAPLGETISILDENEGFIFETIDTAVVENVRMTYPNLENRKVDDFGFYPKYISIMKNKTGVPLC